MKTSHELYECRLRKVKYVLQKVTDHLGMYLYDFFPLLLVNVLLPKLLLNMSEMLNANIFSWYYNCGGLALSGLRCPSKLLYHSP